jgi:hypothetical protein
MYSVPDTPGSFSFFYLLQTGLLVINSFGVKKKTVPFLVENPQQWAGKKKVNTQVIFAASFSLPLCDFSLPFRSEICES